MTEKQYRDAESWALYVHKDQPHGLEDLQHQLQRAASGVIERAARPASAKLLHALYIVLSVCAVVGPIAAVTVFFDLSNAPTRQYNFDADFELTVAFLGFAFGGFFQGRMIYRWWNEGKKRDTATIFLSGLVLVCALGTVLQAYSVTSSDRILITLVLLPAYITGVASIVAILLNAVAPPKPQRQSAPAETAPEINLTELSGDARAAVLKDRRKALKALEARGLLEGHSVDELSERPLGNLTGEEGHSL